MHVHSCQAYHPRLSDFGVSHQKNGINEYRFLLIKWERDFPSSRNGLCWVDLSLNTDCSLMFVKQVTLLCCSALITVFIKTCAPV